MIGIYAIENIVNGKKYIGKTGWDFIRRWRQHKSELRGNYHSNKYLQKSWNKYGEKCFEFYIIEECEDNLLNEKEKYYIELYGTKAPNGYNMNDGGDGGFRPDEETRARMSEKAKKRNPISEVTRRRMSISQKNREPMSEETREKLRKANKGKIGKKPSPETKIKLSLAQSGEKNGFYGKKHSHETKEKIGLSSRGRVKSLLSREKQSMSIRGEKHNLFGKKIENSTSIYFGVSKSIKIKKNGKKYIYWYSRITIDRKYLHIGMFKTEIEAAVARDEYVIKNKLENVHPLNFPHKYKKEE